ncbi:MAG: HD domain-containing protein [Anaerolineales bacterium]|nr:HD domain-containing protein [Anaerolineales bacterium]
MPDTVRLISPERVRDELWKMLSSRAPAQALADLQQHSLLFPILPEITELMGVAQSAPHISDVWAHTLRTVTNAQHFRDWLLGGSTHDDSPATTAWQSALEPWRYRLREHFLQPIAGDHQRVDWLVWQAMWHDAGKAVTAAQTLDEDGAIRYRFLGHEEISAELAARRLFELRFSRVECDLTETVVRAHMRPHHLHDSFKHAPISRRACYRFFRDTGGRNSDDLAGIDVLMLALADYQAIYAAPQPPEWREYLEHVVQLLAFAFDHSGLALLQHPLVDGYSVMRHLNLEPGPAVGAVLERLREAQAAGEVTTRDEALALATAWQQESQG